MRKTRNQQNKRPDSFVRALDIDTQNRYYIFIHKRVTAALRRLYGNWSRTELGISQEDLAELVKVSRQTVSKWENGLGSPSADNLFQLSQALDVPVDALLHEDWTPPDIQVAEIPDSRPGGRRLWLPLAALVLAVGVMIGALLLRGRPWDVVSSSEMQNEVIDNSTIGGGYHLTAP